MRELRGVAASPGIIVGVARPLGWGIPGGDGRRLDASERSNGVRSALAALDAAGAQLDELAADLNRRHRTAEAEIVETGALMAADPELRAQVSALVSDDGLPPGEAILAAAESMAGVLAALDSELLAARAADVRSLGRRAARCAAGESTERPAGLRRGDADPGEDVIAIADDLGPADVVELGAEVRAIALAGGGITGHAAIVARSLGLAAVVGLGENVQTIADGALLVIDGGAGTLVLEPSPDAVAAARGATQLQLRRHAEAAAARNLPARTSDGQLIHVLANVSSAPEVSLALDEGADGVGLLRTELGLLDVVNWPSANQHRERLAPILDLLPGRPATVRLLDFGGDKLPPFLKGSVGRGVQLLREAPEALEAQLEAIVATGATSDLGILIPMVTEPDDIRCVRDRLDVVMARHPDVAPARLGAMIEVPAAVAMLAKLVPLLDFVSIGTNDLSHFQLGLDRGSAAGAAAHHPAVLQLIGRTVEVADDAGVAVAVCGEAASNPVAMPLLIGLGVVELSVGAARVGAVRRWVRHLERAQCVEIAARARAAESIPEVERVSAPLRVLFEID